MNQRLRHAPGLGQGFTLVEVLVALLLVAIALIWTVSPTRGLSTAPAGPHTAMVDLRGEIHAEGLASADAAALAGPDRRADLAPALCPYANGEARRWENFALAHCGRLTRSRKPVILGALAVVPALHVAKRHASS